MSISPSNVEPFNQARARQSKLADQVTVSAKKISTKNCNSNVAFIEAGHLDCHHRPELERIHLLLIDDTSRGFDEIIAGRTHQADSALADIHKRHMVGSTVTELVGL